MSLHLPAMYEKHGPLACFVHERKHKLVKRFCSDQLSKRRPEKALMLQLIAQHQFDLQHLCLEVGLIDPVEASASVVETVQNLRPGTKCVVSSTRASSTDWGTRVRGDMVLLGLEHGHAFGHVFFPHRLRCRHPLCEWAAGLACAARADLSGFFRAH